jgi:hypothetical protein
MPKVATSFPFWSWRSVTNFLDNFLEDTQKFKCVASSIFSQNGFLAIKYYPYWVGNTDMKSKQATFKTGKIYVKSPVVFLLRSLSSSHVSWCIKTRFLFPFWHVMEFLYEPKKSRIFSHYDDSIKKWSRGTFCPSISMKLPNAFSLLRLQIF